MITRKLADKLVQLATYYPVVAVTGPRQAGKTMLCRATFPDKPYVSLESLDFREFAENDPRGFLMEYRQGAVLDEIQQAPGLISFPLRGAIFESWVVSERYKGLAHQGE